MAKVTLFSHGFQPEYEIAFANGLASLGVAVTLVGSDATLVERKASNMAFINLRGSQNPNRPRLQKLLNILRYVGRVMAYLGRNRDSASVVHLNGLFSTRSSLFSLAEAWLTRLVAGPYFLTVHDLLPHDKNTRFARLISKWIFHAAGTLVVHTQKTAEGLEAEFNIPKERILVIEHGIDRLVPLDPALGARWRQANHIPPDAGVALLFGIVMRYKGVDLLLDALARFKAGENIFVVVAGRCRDEKLRSELREKILHHPLRSQIRWIDGFVPESDVPALMQAADCVVMPYRRIDQSGVLFMAFSYGLPVVVSTAGSLADYIEPGHGAVVPIGDVAALAAALRRVALEKNSLPRAEILKRAERYLWCNTLRELAACYRGAFKLRKAPTRHGGERIDRS